MSTDRSVIVVTGSSSGFGALTARALARSGHIVYAGMRATAERNALRVEELAKLSAAEGIDIRGVEMDVQDQHSVDAAIARIIDEQDRVDIVVHNAGHMVLGPLEAFTPEQLAEQYDINVLSTQRVNRAVLPFMRARASGLLVWIGSSSTRGGRPPFLAPYFAAKSGMDALAESYAAELIKFGIETVIIVPGAFTSGTNHFANAGGPVDEERLAEYDEEYGALRESMGAALTDIFPAGHDVSEVADEIVRVVELPSAERPFRVHIDPIKDGSEVVSVVYDRVRAEFFRRIGVEELLTGIESV